MKTKYREREIIIDVNTWSNGHVHVLFIGYCGKGKDGK